MDDKDYEILLALSQEKVFPKPQKNYLLHSLHFPSASRKSKKNWISSFYAALLKEFSLLPLEKGSFPMYRQFPAKIP